MTVMIGPAVDRTDAPLKVRGAAPYPSDVSYPGMAHAVLVGSTAAAGRIMSINVAGAAAAPGVLKVITHIDAPNLPRGPATLLGPSPLPPLQDDRIRHHGQYVAVVVAETLFEARLAAELIDVTYDTTEPLLNVDDPRGELNENLFGSDTHSGDVEGALEVAEIVFDAVYSTATNTNNPMATFATVAVWDGGRVTVHDSTQWTKSVQATIAEVFGIEVDAVRIHAPYVGGGFGAGLRVWPHVILAVLAARELKRPVKIVLTRPQMFTGIGQRPHTTQRIRIGADHDGQLTALEHTATAAAPVEDDSAALSAHVTATAYACPNVVTHDNQRRLNLLTGFMRGPGEAEGNFALESAIDELAYQLQLDPLALRLRNYASVDPRSGLPWSSKALRECYEVGADRFGWARRDPAIGSMRDGRWRVGYGLAGVGYSWWQVRCEARATIDLEGNASVCSAANDPGTGTTTVMRQLASDLLGLPRDRVRFELGDSAMPWSPPSGGSGLTASVGNAVHAACRTLLQRFLDTVVDDERSPLRGCTMADVMVDAGEIRRGDDPSRAESYSDILRRHGLEALTADAEATPPDPQGIGGLALSGPFAAKFVEVRIDEDLGVIRVARVVTVVDAGHILNAKLARSQIIGGTVGGIGQALLEETVIDPSTGRIANATLGDYLVPVNADVPEIDVVFVGEPDPLTPLGAKGVGEIGLVGVAPAIVNAVFHATGRRIRSLPITLDRLL